jgi:hypothetical protein
MANTFQFNPKNLIGLPPKSRTVKDENGSDVVLWSVPLQYRYDSGRTAALELDYPEMNTGRGIKTVDKKSYKKYEIVASLPMDNEDSQDFYETFVKQFNERILEILCEPHIYQAMQPGNKKSGNYDPAKARILLEDKYYASFFTPTNQETGEAAEDASPITKLNLADFDGFKTSFNDITGKPLADPDTGKRLSFYELVDRLGGTGFAFVPRVSFSKIDIGATSIRAVNSLRSVLITNFREGAAEPDMTEVGARYVAKYGNERAQAISERMKTLQHKTSQVSGTMTPTEVVAASCGALTPDTPKLPILTPIDTSVAPEVEPEPDTPAPEQPWTVTSSAPAANPFKGFKGTRSRK